MGLDWSFAYQICYCLDLALRILFLENCILWFHLIDFINFELSFFKFMEKEQKDGYNEIFIFII